MHSQARAVAPCCRGGRRGPASLLLLAGRLSSQPSSRHHLGSRPRRGGGSGPRGPRLEELVLRVAPEGPRQRPLVLRAPGHLVQEHPEAGAWKMMWPHLPPRPAASESPAAVAKAGSMQTRGGGLARVEEQVVQGTLTWEGVGCRRNAASRRGRGGTEGGPQDPHRHRWRGRGPLWACASSDQPWWL